MVNFIASKVAPIPGQYDYWVDTNECPYGGIIKYYDGKVWDYVNNKDEQDLDLDNIKKFIQNLQKVGVVDTFVGSIDPASNLVNVVLNKNTYTIGADGSITEQTSVGETLTIPAATTSLSGVMTAEDKTKLDGLNNYVLPIASTTTLGGIKIGSVEELGNDKYVVKVDDEGNAYISATESTYNGLDSDSIYLSLSAAQGKVLKGLCDALTTKYSELEARIEALETPAA